MGNSAEISIWKNIFKRILPTKNPSIGASRTNFWLIGPYASLCQLRDHLGANPTEIDTWVKNYNLRFGRRKYDIFSKERASRHSFRATISGKEPEKEDRRKIEQYQAVKQFYVHKTLEAHHIVEDSIIKKLGQQTGDLKRENAPTVLVSAELHQQYFTRQMKEFRKQEKFTKQELVATYTNLYRYPEMADLHEISQLIIQSLKVSD